MRIENGVSLENYNPSRSQQNGQKVQAESRGVDTVKQKEIHNAEATRANEERKATTEHEVIQAIQKANKHISSFDRKLEFTIHDATKQIMVKVINTDDNTVIREIPSEKVLDMVAHMWEVAGILVDEKR